MNEMKCPKCGSTNTYRSKKFSVWICEDSMHFNTDDGNEYLEDTLYESVVQKVCSGYGDIAFGLLQQYSK